MGKMSRNSLMHWACLRIEMGTPPISAYFFPKSFISTFQVVKYNVNQRNHILYSEEIRQEVIQTCTFSLEYLDSWLWFLFLLVNWELWDGFFCLSVFFVFSHLSLLHSTEGEVKRKLPKMRILHQFYFSQLFHSSLFNSPHPIILYLNAIITHSNDSSPSFPSECSIIRVPAVKEHSDDLNLTAEFDLEVQAWCIWCL